METVAQVDQDMLEAAEAVHLLLEQMEAQTVEEMVVLVQQLIFQLHLLQKVVAVVAVQIMLLEEPWPRWRR